MRFSQALSSTGADREFSVLSWSVILEALLESEFLRKNGDDEDGPISAHLVSIERLWNTMSSHNDGQSMYGLPSDSRKTMYVDPDLQSLQVLPTHTPLHLPPIHAAPIEFFSVTLTANDC